MVFEDLVGQAHVTTTLRNAIATNRISHAYIFSGPRGCGKTTTARILAKAINCPTPKNFNPDNQCDICKEITDGRSIDVQEIDGASNRGVEEVRTLRESVRYAPVRGKYKVYIIDEVHMLTKEAFNALLKTLEEPPPHILFIFATTEVHKVPATILSRCQRFDFRRISVEEIMARLRLIAEKENISIDDDALLILARKGDGSMRDSQSIFDQIISYCGTTVTAGQIIQALNIVDEELYFRVTDLISAGDPGGGLALVDEILHRGYDIREFLTGLNEHFRNLLVVRSTGSAQLVETSEAYRKRYEEIGARFSETDLFRLIKLANDIEASLRWTDQPRFRLEVGLLQMIKMDRSVAIDSLLQEIGELKKNVALPENNSHEFKVSGTVRASQPTVLANRPRIDAPPAPPTQRKTLSTPPPELTTVSYPKPRTSIVSEPLLPSIAVEEKWKSFVKSVSMQRVAVGTMLGKSHLKSIEGDTLRVICPDDIHLTMLSRNKEFLTDLAQQIYGAKVRFETILSTDSTAPPKKEHPVIEALKRELGAEPID